MTKCTMHRDKRFVDLVLIPKRKRNHLPSLTTPPPFLKSNSACTLQLGSRNLFLDCTVSFSAVSRSEPANSRQRGLSGARKFRLRTQTGEKLTVINNARLSHTAQIAQLLRAAFTRNNLS